MQNDTEQRGSFCREAVGVLSSLHTRLAADAVLAEGEILQEAVRKGKFLKLQGTVPVAVCPQGTGNILKPKQCIKVNSLLLHGMELQELKEILSSNLVRGKDKILTQGCDLPLKAFRLLGVSRRRRIANNNKNSFEKPVFFRNILWTIISQRYATSKNQTSFIKSPFFMSQSLDRWVI